MATRRHATRVKTKKAEPAAAPRKKDANAKLLAIAIGVVAVLSAYSLLNNLPKAPESGFAGSTDEMRAKAQASAQAEADRIAGAIDATLEFRDVDTETWVTPKSLIEYDSPDGRTMREAYVLNIDEKGVWISFPTSRLTHAELNGVTAHASIGGGMFEKDDKAPQRCARGDSSEFAPGKTISISEKSDYYIKGSSSLYQLYSRESLSLESDFCVGELKLVREQLSDYDERPLKQNRSVLTGIVQADLQEALDTRYSNQTDLIVFLDEEVKSNINDYLDEYAGYLEQAGNHRSCVRSTDVPGFIITRLADSSGLLSGPSIPPYIADDGTVNVGVIFSRFDIECQTDNGKLTYELTIDHFKLDVSKIM